MVTLYLLCRYIQRQERLQGGIAKRLESLQMPQMRIAADYMDEHEIQAKFKKPKRKVNIINDPISQLTKLNNDCTVGLVVKRSPHLSTALSVVSSSPWDKTLCESQIVVLTLGDLSVRFMYVCKIPRNTGCVLLMLKKAFKNKPSNRTQVNKTKLQCISISIF